MTITDQTIHQYCAISTDTALTDRQRRRMCRAIGDVETRIAATHPAVRDDYPRVMQANITMDISVPFTAPIELVPAVSVIRQPRYAVRNREAPKRSTLIRRLWSALR